jgi:hypothetical protein
MAERSLAVRTPRGALALAVLAAIGASLAATVVEPALLLGTVLALLLLVLD